MSKALWFNKIFFNLDFALRIPCDRLSSDGELLGLVSSLQVTGRWCDGVQLCLQPGEFSRGSGWRARWKHTRGPRWAILRYELAHHACQGSAYQLRSQPAVNQQVPCLVEKWVVEALFHFYSKCGILRSQGSIPSNVASPVHGLTGTSWPLWGKKIIILTFHIVFGAEKGMQFFLCYAHKKGTTNKCSVIQRPSDMRVSTEGLFKLRNKCLGGKGGRGEEGAALSFTAEECSLKTNSRVNYLLK